MHSINWVHAPNAHGIIQRLVLKYTRFFSLFASYPGKTAVPTLDVDLAWHTHQLSPSDYYAHSLETTGELF
jgi:hypothetical protein